MSANRNSSSFRQNITYDRRHGTANPRITDLLSTRGLYENQDKNQPNYNLRGRFQADEAGGRSLLLSVLPTPLTPRCSVCGCLAHVQHRTRDGRVGGQVQHPAGDVDSVTLTKFIHNFISYLAPAPSLGLSSPRGLE
jgi:hypothetical protein